MSSPYLTVQAIVSRRKLAGIFFRELASKIEATIGLYQDQNDEFRAEELGATLSSLHCEMDDSAMKLTLSGEFSTITAIANRPPGSIVLTRSSSSSFFNDVETEIQICLVEVIEADGIKNAQVRLSSHGWLQLPGQAPEGTPVYEYAKLIAAAAVVSVLEHDLANELKCKKQSIGLL
jgi:hypothetical protein